MGVTRRIHDRYCTWEHSIVPCVSGVSCLHPCEVLYFLNGACLSSPGCKVFLNHPISHVTASPTPNHIYAISFLYSNTTQFQMLSSLPSLPTLPSICSSRPLKAFIPSMLAAPIHWASLERQLWPAFLQTLLLHYVAPTACFFAISS